MTKRPFRLTPVSPEAFAKLQREADELARLQDLLNRLPLSLQVEDLSDTALERLRQIARTPVQTLCGPDLLRWNNLCRPRGGLATK